MIIAREGMENTRIMLIWYMLCLTLYASKLCEVNLICSCISCAHTLVIAFVSPQRMSLVRLI